MIFTCCHPALEEKTQVALTLRTLGGLTTEQIALAFIDKPDAMAQRLVRAKKKITAAGIPYRIPERDQLQERLNAVLRVIYLIFNEGYAAHSGDQLTRTDLSNEAIRLARIIESLLPEETEVQGLLALMLLHDSRRYARLSQEGQMVALEDQNRARWDRSKITAGSAILPMPIRSKPGWTCSIRPMLTASWNATNPITPPAPIFSPALVAPVRRVPLLNKPSPYPTIA